MMNSAHDKGMLSGSRLQETRRDGMRRPLPTPDELQKPFWQAARQGRLCVQACSNCGKHRYPEAPVCAVCLSPESTWVDVPPQGEVKAWCRFHRAYFDGFELPYTVLLVELSGGARIYANFTGAAAEVQPYVGMKVRAEFEEIGDGVVMPKFRPD